MDKDYRLELLSFLKEHHPNKVNISHLVLAYLNKTKNSRQSYRHMLDTLQVDGFILINPEEAQKLSINRGGIFNDSIVLVNITHSGIDEVTRIKKQNYDLSNVERVYKSYHTTRFLAWAGFILGLLAILIKVAETLNILPRQK